MDTQLIRAEDVEIGDDVYLDGKTHHVTGSYVDGNGRIRLEYAGRWYTHRRGDRLEVKEERGA